MKRGLLGSTALIGAAALTAGTARAAEAPTWKLTGNMNFQFYYVDQDKEGRFTATDALTFGSPASGALLSVSFWDPAATAQDHDWYFGVDEAELQLNVAGTADNGLNYGFKIEINANKTDSKVADEARLQFSGGWGTLQMGDEDGAEDIMNYGGENLMGGTGGFDGDQDDYFYDAGKITIVSLVTAGALYTYADYEDFADLGAPSYPKIAGDTSDQTKISYFSPRIAGFQVGASLTPIPNNGDDFKADGAFENHFGLGANYDNSFGGIRVQASAVYSAASSNLAGIQDVSAWSVGGIVGFGPVSVGANYTDNGDSGEIKGLRAESSYWNAAVGFESGSLYLSAGYMAGVKEIGLDLAIPWVTDSEYTHTALTADYSVAPGLAVYAEVNFIEDSLLGVAVPAFSNDATSLVLGANVSF